MIGRQNSNGDTNSVPTQVIYVNPNLVKGVFNFTAKVDNDKVTVTDTTLSGYLRSIAFKYDERFKVNKVIISLEENDQPKLGSDGENVRHVYRIETSLGMNVMNFLNSLTTAVNELGEQKLYMSLSLVEKKEKDQNGKYTKTVLGDKGEKLYNFLLMVRNGEKMQTFKYWFGTDPEKAAGYNDPMNAAHTAASEQAKEASSAIPRTLFWKKYIMSNLSRLVFNNSFQALLAEQGKRAILEGDENGELKYSIVDLNTNLKADIPITRSPQSTNVSTDDVNVYDDGNVYEDNDEFTNGGDDDDMPF